VSLFCPFAGLRPGAPYAAEVAAPPYDVLSSSEARARAAGKPLSFLHVSKAEIDLPSQTDPYSAQVYARATENLRRMMQEGVLVRDPARCFYAYRLIMGSHSQIGLAGTASIADYDNGRIRRHEFTRPDKEDDRVRQIEALEAHTGPVLLVYPSAPAVDDVLASVAIETPAIDIVADTGVRHTIWPIRDEDRMTGLVRAFDAMSALYIADGHHRSAAASRVAAARRAANKRHAADESYNYFLAVAFPHHRMQILAYNRVVTDLNGLTRDSFLARVAEDFEVRVSSEAVVPARPGELGLYLPGSWHHLSIKSDRIPVGDPVARLDVSLLTDRLLTPILGIGDVRRDKRVDFVGGIRGTVELEKLVNSGEMACAFSMFPTRMQDLMKVADANQIMPPKSTWFEPKLADGLISHVLD
jgi:uncharacterized protein (DUF1015 family)